VPVRWIKVTEEDNLCSVRNWFDESVDPAINERFVRKRRYADGFVERKYVGVVSVNLNPSPPQQRLYRDLHLLWVWVVNAPERLQVEVDVERLNTYFLTRPLLNGADFSCATVSESEIDDAVISGRISLSLVLRYLCH
jgi:hypothetical protein